MTLFVTLAMLVVWADEAHAIPTAEVLFEQGQRAYDRADYTTAIARWKASYETSKEPALLFNLGQAFRLAGDCHHALTSYRQFVALDPTSERRSIVDSLVVELEGTCSDGKDVDAHPRTTDHHLRTFGIIAMAGGGVLAIGGLFVGQHAATLGDEVTASCSSLCNWNDQRDKDASGRRSATIGYALDGIGIAIIATGVILYVADKRRTSIVAMPSTDGRSAGIAWVGAW